jgi:hypothetical protein
LISAPYSCDTDALDTNVLPEQALHHFEIDIYTILY